MVCLDNTKLIYTLLAITLINASVSTDTITDKYSTNTKLLNTVIFAFGWIVAYYAFALNKNIKGFIKIGMNLRSLIFLVPCLIVLISYILIEKELKEKNYEVEKVTRIVPLTYILGWAGLILLLTFYSDSNKMYTFGLGALGAGIIVSSTLFVSPTLSQKFGSNCPGGSLYTLGWFIILMANALLIEKKIPINFF